MLKKHFLNLINKYSSDFHFNENCWSEIEKKYNSKNRYYHNLNHLSNMITELEFVKNDIKSLDCILFSTYYHDIIYNTKKSDNEEKSAIFLEKALEKTSFQFIDICKNQIIATKNHEESIDNDINIFLDLDMSILGQSRAEYIEYCQQIRKEYNIYPDFFYKKGRKKALLSFLEQERIFKTHFFNKKYEKQARQNILSEIDNL